VSEAAETCQQLARRLAGLRDLTLRVRYVRSVLAELDPMVAADLLLLARGGAEERSPGLGELHLAALLGLAEDDAAALRSTLADAAMRRGHDEVAMLLRPFEDPPPERVTGSSSSTTKKTSPAASKGVPERAGRPLTLGERKALARRADRPTLERALRDPSPEVTRVLLGNPSLTEPDVVRLSARRDLDPAALAAIFRSPRWIVRPAVQRALVKNPSTPLAVSLGLAPLLEGPEARQVAEAPGLDPRLRRACDRRPEVRTVH